MSESDAVHELIARKRRKVRRLYIIVSGVIGAALVLTAAVIFTQGVGLRITPEDAAASASVSIVRGFGISIGTKVYSLGGEQKARVRSPGFVPVDIDIVSGDGSRYVEVVMREKPATLVLASTPESPHSRWIVNGNLLSQSERFTTELKAGEHTVKLDNPYFESVTELVRLERGQERELVLPLVPVQGSLQLASNPKGAQVLVNGEPVGQSDMSIPLAGGEYEVEVRLESYGTVNDRVRITRARQHVQRSYRLLSNPGFLRFDLSPAKGKLYIDGRETHTRGKPVSVSAGSEHVVLYEVPGYLPGKQVVRVNAGQTQELRLALDDDIGKVQIRSEPSATVKVNGRLVGETPLTLELPGLVQTISLEKPGYVTELRKVTPTADSPRLVSVTMRTELEQRMKASSPRYTNPAGLEFLRFRPHAFEMGAPRSEKGQRANETQRRIQLSKVFYVSKTEVTEAQFQKFRSGQSSAQAKLPQTMVSWEDAARFCNWLSAQEGLPQVYRFSGSRYGGANIRSDGYRLPTEAEWEWLARKAGRKGQTRFTWGNDYTVPKAAGNFADELAKGKVQFYIQNYKDGFAALAPVGSFGVERSGLYDLSGNVREWVHDYYIVSPPAGPVGADPTGPDFGEGHVVKGSSWRSGTASQLRAAYRDAEVQPRDDLGFRVARYVYGAEDAL